MELLVLHPQSSLPFRPVTNPITNGRSRTFQINTYVCQIVPAKRTVGALNQAPRQ